MDLLCRRFSSVNSLFRSKQIVSRSTFRLRLLPLSFNLSHLQSHLSFSHPRGFLALLDLLLFIHLLVVMASDRQSSAEIESFSRDRHREMEAVPCFSGSIAVSLCQGFFHF